VHARKSGAEYEDDAMTQTNSSGSVRSVQNALRILELLSHHQPIGVSELARQLDLAKSSTFRSLRTLQEAGWARPSSSDDRRWELTTKVFMIGLAASTEGSLREQAIAEMTNLRDKFGETVHLGVPDEQDLVIIARMDGTNSLRTFLELGTRAPLHASAGGRAILSAFPDPQVDRILDRGIQAYTERTTMSREAVWTEIRLARERGYAVNEAEWRADIAAVGSPIVSPAGQVLGSVSISMPIQRYQDTDLAQAGALTVEACRRISARFCSGGLESRSPT
jgi:IclR family acetate operon transcriptional repressor